MKILDWAYEDLSPNKDGTIQKRHTSEKGSGYLSPAIGAYVQSIEYNYIILIDSLICLLIYF